MTILLMVLILNLLKPTGYVMLYQFNIQHFYIPSTFYLCVLYLSQNKQLFLLRRHKLVGVYNLDKKFLLHGTE
jgi:hypothetical protein